jgi:predicted DsbA family dithiol-disulfide isomerase
MSIHNHQLTVISDVICPWCYIGKNRLDIALKRLRQDYDVIVLWKAFELNPTMPREGLERNSYLRYKFGSQLAAEKVYRNIENVAYEDGLKMAFGNIAKTPNTRMSHKLIASIESSVKQNELVDALFEAYFIHGKDIGNKQVLVDIAKKLQLSQQAQDSLESNEAINSLVVSQEKHAAELGVTGVPSFVYNDRLLFSGAQSPETMYLSLKQAFVRLGDSFALEDIRG